MAITGAAPGISAIILVDGEPLKEYIDNTIEDGDDTVTRFVEALSDKNFRILLQVEKGTEITRAAVSFAIFVDGESLANPFIPTSWFQSSNGTSIIEGKELPNGMIQKLKFITLETVSDGRGFVKGASDMSVLGTVIVDVSFVDIVAVETFDELSKNSALGGPGIVHEEAIKGEAITHGVNFENPVALGQDPTEVWTSYNEDQKSYSRIVLKYRSLEALQSMGIIPRAPSPEPIERRAPETLTLEEIVELQKSFVSQQAKKDTMVKIKRERGENARPRKRSRLTPGATYLSLDDDEQGVRELSTATLDPEEETEVIDLT
ncbi:uncharacterized protein MYCGRDRAFT_96993 [Zymoseptoria tritici IPO323]|uniref:DUF7918 domain-containing protein n=1 Tax=Zymoseptoria tritici (strain CBS 115943 / IPO323) TaxID=336722 RepID=F9XNJ9_ZYMTI|nr:uncharacterized protein MYCGRDRAFT_96993 [Zymoseptoria tritici IPO323]EGP82883.1 hypothetical protein MYCGRDRAFT_96993 [Zymoseptoria tritici IPO323]